jgi:hypothetical protein
MFKQGRHLVGLMSVLLVLTAALAGIPEPPAVLHGWVLLEGQRVESTDDVTVLARVDAASQPIGSYHMGDNQNAGSNYVLRLRLESLVRGQQQSDDAGMVGQRVSLFVRVADGPERSAGQFDIVESGAIVSMNLTVTTMSGHCADEDGDIDLSDHASFLACMTGVGGQVGLGCGCADYNGDGDADLADWTRFQLAFTGTN